MQLNNIDELHYPLDINSYILENDKCLNNIVIPLIYSIIENHEYDNVILIHDKINNPQQFALYSNSKSLSIIYNESSSNDELIELLNKYFTNIKRIAFVFHNSNCLKEFTNNKPFFDYNDLEINTDYSLNMQFIINIANKFNVQNLDYLACNTLLYEHWKKYFDILKEKTNTTIGASNNLIGNIKYGGDWVLENINEDVRNIYFTDSLENYQYTLVETTLTQNGGTITLNQNSPTSITCTLTSGTQTINSDNWPVRINNTSNNILTVIFNTNIVIDSSFGDTTAYFIIGSNNITINGNNKVITININDYPGLFQNGTDQNNGNTNIIIQDLGVTSNSSLVSIGGWIGQSYFAYGISGTISITNCYSTGRIKTRGGGIFGSYIGKSSSASIIVTNCYSTGTIETSGGGIFGDYAGESSLGTITVINCYSTGNIGNYGGGIFGSYAGTITATNCYSTGYIGYGGGIFGYDANAASKAINCYTTGIFSSDNGIYGTTRGVIQKCYPTNGVQNWNDTDAESNLDNSSDVWTDINSNSSTPWLLSSFNATIYVPNSYTGNSDFTTNKGEFEPEYTYSIITVNSSYTIPNTITINTIGEITFTNPIETYIVKVLVSKGTSPNYYQYNINSFTYIYTIYKNPWLLSSFNANIYDPNSYTGTNDYITVEGSFKPGYIYSIITVNDSYTIPNNISINTGNGIITFTNPIETYIVKVLVGKTINRIYYQYNTNKFTYIYSP